MNTPPRSWFFRLAFALFIGAGCSARAQAVATGSIEGRVFDPARAEYLQNARVTVPGTTLEAFTAAGGYDVLGNVPAGTASLRVFFTGLAPITVSVPVAAGETTTKDITLSTTSERGRNA